MTANGQPIRMTRFLFRWYLKLARSYAHAIWEPCFTTDPSLIAIAADLNLIATAIRAQSIGDRTPPRETDTMPMIAKSQRYQR